MGATTKLILTPEIAEQICADVEAGNTLECAAGCAGVNKSTICRWNSWGKEGREPYAKFAEMLEMARCKAERNRVGVLTAAQHLKSGDMDWRAASWWLSHARADGWSETRKIEVKVREELESALDKLQSRLSPELYEKVLDVLTAGESGEESEAGDEGDEAEA